MKIAKHTSWATVYNILNIYTIRGILSRFRCVSADIYRLYIARERNKTKCAIVRHKRKNIFLASCVCIFIYSLAAAPLMRYKDTNEYFALHVTSKWSSHFSPRTWTSATYWINRKDFPPFSTNTCTHTLDVINWADFLIRTHAGIFHLYLIAGLFVCFCVSRCNGP